MKLPRFLQAVLVLDLVFVVALAAGGDREATPASAPGSVGRAEPTAEALAVLGRELAERSARLERRETEIRELIRGQEVLRRAGLLDGAGDAPGREIEARPPEVNVAFESLGKAYAAMEPDSAASALSALAARDREAVIAMLIGWNSRTSGAILDALTQRDPELAADLSYAIWKRGAG